MKIIPEVCAFLIAFAVVAPSRAGDHEMLETAGLNRTIQHESGAD